MTLLNQVTGVSACAHGLKCGVSQCHHCGVLAYGTTSLWADEQGMELKIATPRPHDRLEIHHYAKSHGLILTDLGPRNGWHLYTMRRCV